MVSSMSMLVVSGKAKVTKEQATPKRPNNTLGSQATVVFCRVSSRGAMTLPIRPKTDDIPTAFVLWSVEIYE